MNLANCPGSCGTLAQTNSRFMPMAIGSQREPVVSPSQNMNEYSQDRRNRSHCLRPSVSARAITLKTTPTTSERERIRSITAGGAKSVGVMRTTVWLIALHLPQAVLPGAGPKYLVSVFHLLLVYSICRDLPGLRLYRRRAGLTAAREYMRRWPSGQRALPGLHSPACRQSRC